MANPTTDIITHKSKILKANLANIPKDMKDFPQWILWAGDWLEDKQKWSKIPKQASGANASVANPATWSTFEKVAAAYETGKFDGVGFVLTEEDPFACIDIDKVDLDNLPDYANEIIHQSFTEKSVSGKGLHVWTKYSHNKKTHKNKNTALDIELYSKDRFIAVTGVMWNDMALSEGKGIDDYIDAYFQREEPVSAIVEGDDSEPAVEDTVVLARMMNHKDAEKRKKLQSYFNGEWSAYYESPSEARLGFFNYLAFYTECNRKQMERIFKDTDLYDPDKFERDKGIEDAIAWAFPKLKKKQSFELQVEESKQAFIPKPFKVIEGSLYKEVESKQKDETGSPILMDVRVCRHAPEVVKAYRNIEKSQLHYDLQWVDRGRVYTETITAGSLATKKELLKLADMSLGVNDVNARDLINYLDKYVSYNELEEDHLVERLGHIKDGFIHPLNAEEKRVKILPPDAGERQYLEAFQTAGTSEEWIEEVFERIKHHPKVVLMVLSSFTSVILKDLKLDPFIIDMAGVTSEGKTTALKVAASVWGTGHLVGEWNLTKVAAERKAAFLNSFPLMLDDTRKANPKELQAFVYNFSGGRSKGRGSVEGSQAELTWNNLLLSTGEDSLNAYAENAGGVAARVLPITGLPFEDEDFKFFNEIYGAIDNHYGAIGLEFLKHWEDKKKIALPMYQEYNDLFQQKAQDNKVISRISRHYAAIVYTGRLLNEFFGIDIDIRLLSYLFDEINAENKSTDKPMQLLESMLSDLDSDRGAVFGQFLPQREIKAVYKHGTLYLLPNYLKDFLKSEQSTIRSEWLRREITIERTSAGKTVDYQQIKHGGKKFRGVAIRPEIVESLGFDFEESNN